MQLTSNTSAKRRQPYPQLIMPLDFWKQDQAAYSGEFNTTNTIVTGGGGFNTTNTIVTGGGEFNTTNTIVTSLPVSMAQTNAGPVVPQHKKASEAPAIVTGFRVRDGIFELRRLSGFTWDELADLLSVTRRSLHLWANGGPINTSNEKRVRDVLVTMRKLDRGTAHENRSLLIAPQPGGGVFSDLLRGQRFEEALARAGHGRGRRAVSMDMSANKKRAAAKPSVADMLGGPTDRIHSDKGGSLPPRGGPRRI
jgi:hypothetical protein